MIDENLRSLVVWPRCRPRKELACIDNKELENLIYSLLRDFDNVGCVLPDNRGFFSYDIKTTLCEERMRDDIPLFETIE